MKIEEKQYIINKVYKKIDKLEDYLLNNYKTHYYLIYIYNIDYYLGYLENLLNQLENPIYITKNE